MAKDKIAITVAIVAILAASGYWAYQKYGLPDYGSSDGDIACAQDVRSCPDGSYVSRVPPTCEFRACPGGETPLPPEEILDTSNWGTYRNDEYGFEFKYPYSCSPLFYPDSPGGELSNFLVDCGKERLDDVTGFIYLSLVATYIPELLKNPETERIGEFYLPNGEKALQLFVKPYNSPEKIISSFITKGNSELTLEIRGPSKNSTELDVYNLFLSTFKLIK